MVQTRREITNCMKVKSLRIAISGGRGRLAPHIAANLLERPSEVVCFSRSAGDGFQAISLLTEPPNACRFRRPPPPWLEHRPAYF